jgi:hypothetical protein
MYVNNRDAKNCVAQCKPFTNSTKSFSGQLKQYSIVWFGRLPMEWCRELSELSKSATGCVYVVWSYGTPIAWFYGGVWSVPDVKYSVTTSRHQNIVRAALDNAYSTVFTSV